MKYLISSMQVLAYFLFYLPVRIMYRPQRIVAPALKHLPSSRFIIAANHQCRMDPFLILSQLPFGTFLSLLPIRFITADKYMNTWWKRYFLSTLGCYSITPEHQGRKDAIDYSVELLQQGQTLFIFPEGKMVKDNKPVQAKRGIAIIAKKGAAAIIPAAIDGMKETQRRESQSFQVNFGTPIAISNHSGESLNQAQNLMRYVYRLPLNPRAYYGPRISFETALATLNYPITAKFQLAYSIEDDTRSADMTNHVLVPTVVG